MKKFHNISFAKQLTYYLLSALIITFILIAVALTNTLNQFIQNNAYTQARVLATNVLLIFDKQIVNFENIPNCIDGLAEEVNSDNAKTIPGKILQSYPILSGCSVHYDPTHPKLGQIGHVHAIRNPNGQIVFNTAAATFDPYHPDPACIMRQCHDDAFWAHTTIEKQPMLSLCTPFRDAAGIQVGMVKIDFPLKTITDLLCDYRIFRSGHLFIVDQEGRYIAHSSDSLMSDYSNIFSIPTLDNEKKKTISSLVKGETGCTNIVSNGKNCYLYLTPVPQTQWRLGIVCPYDEIMTSSSRLFILLAISLSIGSLFLFICTVNIVHRLSDPLKQLAYTARQMAKGRFDIKLASTHSSREIQELYTSFRYMQKSIIDYIERLTITTAEKEQMNSEMRVAQRIQHSFLPKRTKLPPNIELFGELRQSRKVGGDLYDYFVKDHRLYFAIGDVSGKGIPAALYMSSITKLFRYVANDKHSTAAICDIINQHSCDDGEDDIYITMFLGILDMNTEVVTFTNAGHPYPLIVHDSGEVTILDKYPDVPIGVLEDHRYSEHVFTLTPNSSILLYTDGITDSENKNSEFYGKENLMNCLQSVSEKTPEHLIRAILADIQRHTAGSRQSDDLTVLSILYKGMPESTTAG